MQMTMWGHLNISFPRKVGGSVTKKANGTLGPGSVSLSGFVDGVEWNVGQETLSNFRLSHESEKSFCHWEIEQKPLSQFPKGQRLYTREVLPWAQG